MENYAKAMKHKLPVTKDVVEFNDKNFINQWVINSVRSMKQADIINGKINNQS